MKYATMNDMVTPYKHVELRRTYTSDGLLQARIDGYE